MTQVKPISAEDRTRLLCQAFGWQGGTIHQIAEETGCKVRELLYQEQKNNASFSQGWFSARTCELAHNLAVNFPRHRGDVDYWIGVARGLQLKEQGI